VSIPAMGLGELADSRLTGVLVRALGTEGCAELFADGRRVVFEPGQTIFALGEAGQSLILLREGRVEVSITSLSGRKSVLAQMGPGEVLGEIAALDGGPRSADAVASTRVIGTVMSRDNVLAFVVGRPEIARSIIIELCGKVRNASEMFLTQSVIEGEPRLARALLRLFEKWGETGTDGSETLAERFSQQEIGEFSGLARENVNRQLKAWAESGLIRMENRRIVLVDREGLAAISDI